MLANEFKVHAEIEDDHWWFKVRRNVILMQLLRFSSVDVRHIVEIGCGTGGNLKFLSRYVDKVTGVDISSDAVSYARQRVKGDILLGDFRQVLNDKWQDVDVVLLADVLEHVEDDAGFLNDIIAAIRPGAIILIIVPAHKLLWSNHDVALGHKRRYHAAMLKRLWKNKPVKVLLFSPLNFVLSPLIFIGRLLQAKNNDPQHSDLKKHSAIVNAVLYFLFNLETWWIRRFVLPWGCSYTAVLKKV